MEIRKENKGRKLADGKGESLKGYFWGAGGDGSLPKTYRGTKDQQKRENPK